MSQHLNIIHLRYITSTFVKLSLTVKADMTKLIYYLGFNDANEHTHSSLSEDDKVSSVLADWL